MLYFANPSGPKVRAAMIAGQLGFIDTPKQRNVRPDGVTWCADNGCYGKGYPGDAAWLAWLESNAHDVARCAFAVAPDVVGDAEATLARSRPFLEAIRSLGYPAAYVAQDGTEQVEPPWKLLDVLFIGGSTQWKLGPHAAIVAEAAKARGKWVHCGRVNSERRLKYAQAIGCDSADGTFLKHGPDKNLPQLLTWLRGTANQPALGDL